MPDNTTIASKEFIAELLKERIYATLALLAVLISIDTSHYSAEKALLIVWGTIISLWGASVVSALMSRRVVYQGEQLDADRERELQLKKHAPMLAALGLPTFLLSLAYFHVISLSIAINISIASALLLLVTWSVLSARSIRARQVPTIVLVAAELAIGLGIVALKIAIGH